MGNRIYYHGVRVLSVSLSVCVFAYAEGKTPQLNV